MSFLKKIFQALSRLERRLLWAAVACVLIGATGLIIFFIKNNTVSVPARGGTYTEGMVGQPSYVNPVLAATDADQGLTRLLFASLAELSDSMQTSADGLTIEARLKQGLTWSDGQPLTSDDVVFTLRSIQDPGSHSPLAGLFQGIKAERTSTLEIDFHIENTLLAGVVGELRPVPQHLYRDIPAANWRLSEYNLRPVGSGPYVFASHDTGADGWISAYSLNPNPRWSGNAPYLKKVNFDFFRDANGLLSAFNSGQIQGFGTTDSILIDKVKRPYALTRWTTPTIYAVFWNTTANPALGAFETRWALDLVTKRDEILSALKGYGTTATGPFPPALFSADAPEASASSSDPAQILEVKDWQKGEDGVWTKKIAKTDVRLAFTLTVPDIPFLRDAAEKLAGQWRAFGADVHLTMIPPNDQLSETIKNRSYDGLLFGNTVRGIGDIYPFWHSSGRFSPGLNLAIYKNTKVDGLLEDLRGANGAEETRAGMTAVSRLISDDEAAVFLFSSDNLYVASKNIRGVSGGFLGSPADRLEQLPQWYVKTARRLK